MPIISTSLQEYVMCGTRGAGRSAAMCASANWKLPHSRTLNKLSSRSVLLPFYISKG